jgi:hypothetical protein
MLRKFININFYSKVVITFYYLNKDIFYYANNPFVYCKEEDIIIEKSRNSYKQLFSGFELQSKIIIFVRVIKF